MSLRSEFEFEQDPISTPQIQRIRRDLKRRSEAFPKKAAAEITSATLTACLEKKRPEMKTHNNRCGKSGAGDT